MKMKLPMLSEIVIDKDKFGDSFKNIKDIINLNIIKYYLQKKDLYQILEAI